MGSIPHCYFHLASLFTYLYAIHHISCTGQFINQTVCCAALPSSSLSSTDGNVLPTLDYCKT